jgi:hypothetical protein
MARDNSKAGLQLQLVLLALDGARPSGTLEWVSAAAPVVTQAAVGAGHWAAGRRQRAVQRRRPRIAAEREALIRTLQQIRRNLSAG